MVAVGLNEAQLRPYLEKVRSTGELIIACYNSPKNNTVSGDEVMVDALKELLNADGVFARKLNVRNAYHSAHMKEIADEYLRLMGDLSSGQYFNSPHEIHMFSTVTGRQIDSKTLDAQYWVDNMVSPVRFTDGLTAMCFQKNTTGQAHLRMNATAENIFADHVIEIGPHSALQSAIKESIAAKGSQSSIVYLPVLNRNENSTRVILTTVGTLSSKGSPVDILAVNSASKTSKQKPKMLVDLPPYSFNHSSKTMYESRLSKNYRFRKFPRHDLFGAPVADWNAETPRWRHFIRLNENPWLKDHMVRWQYFCHSDVVMFLTLNIGDQQLYLPRSGISYHGHRSIKADGRPRLRDHWIQAEKCCYQASTHYSRHEGRNRNVHIADKDGRIQSMGFFGMEAVPDHFLQSYRR